MFFPTGLLGAAEVPSNETSAAQNQIPCPGECVHAFTSILCSRVIEQFDCGAAYLRCCVSNDFNFGTVVETSAPLPDESSTDSSTEYEVFLVSTQPSPEPTTNLIHKQPPSVPTPSKNEAKPTPNSAVTTAASAISSTQKPGPCKGICVENIFVRYCGTTIPGVCDKGATCCASSSQDDEEPPLETTTYSIPISWSTNKVQGSKPQRDTQQASFNSEASSASLSTLPAAPICPGSCVAPLFSLLCDAVRDGYFCPNDGRCCMSNDETDSPPAPTTTVSNFASHGNSCPGACIPVFLRGMCNRPSEVMIQADCEQDYVCCHQPDVKDHLHVESPQIPLLRPGGHPNVPLGPQQKPPLIHQQHPQRPNIQFTGKPVPPVPVPHIHQQGNGNQIYMGNGQTGYRPVPPGQSPMNNHRKPAYPQNGNYGNDASEQSMLHNKPPPNISGQSGYHTGPHVPPHGNNPYNQPPYPQNNNYGNGANDPSGVPNIPHYTNGTLQIEFQTRPQMLPHGNSPFNHPYPQNINSGNDKFDENVFIGRPQQSDSSIEISPGKFNGLPHQSSAESSNVDQNSQKPSDTRRQNFTHIAIPLIPINHAPKYPPNGLHQDSSRFIPPVSIQNTRPVMQPEENAGGRKPQNPPDRFVSASVGFSPNNMRPVGNDFNHKPHHIEKFQPPTSQENSPLIPLPKNSSVTIANSNKPPVPVGSVHEVPLPQAYEPHKNTGLVPFQESFRPVQNQHRPVQNQHRPVQGPTPSRPIETVSQLRPIQSSSETRPIQTSSEPEKSSEIPSHSLRPNETPQLLKPNENPSQSPRPNETPSQLPRPIQNPSQPRPVQAPSQSQQPIPSRQPIPNLPSSISSNETSIVPSIANNGTLKKLKPECPGSCIGSFLKFTCFGNNAIYDGFSCEPEGTMCCTLVEHIQKYEEHVQSGNPLVLAKPSVENPQVDGNTFYFILYYI